MPRGGARPGAGRPVGGRDRIKPGESGKVYENAETPLAYMLSVMNDPSVDPRRRDEMAKAAAPYVHTKAGESSKGKKEQREIEAQTAEQGTSWDALLN